MDIHRCRFLNFPPSAINALAFSYASGSSQRNQPLRLAIGRANGDIEIWNPSQGRWIHETTCKGGRNRSVEGLVWTQDPDETDENGRITYGRLRLFSIGYSSYITEWDLLTGTPLQHSVGTHPEIWCLAAQPPRRIEKGNQDSDPKQTSQEDDSQRLIAGCSDGSIVLLSTRDGGLTTEKVVARNTTKNGRVLSITFQNRHTVVAGFADGFVRVYDIRSGSQIRAMSLGSGPSATRKGTLVWTVHCLADGTVLAGDSTGSLTFWDGRNYAQLQKIHSHEADILCMASSEDSKLVFTGGMDRRLIAYSREQSSQRPRWMKSSQSRAHEHDIKAMTAFENRKMSFLVSGGLDLAPTVTPLRQFGKEHRRRLPYTPQTPPVTSAQRLVVSWWDNNVAVWRIQSRKAPTIEGTFVDEDPNYKHLAQLNLKDEEHITWASLSASGRILAVATSRSVKLFRLSPQPLSSAQGLKVKKLEVPTAIAVDGARILQFSPDDKWLLLVTVANKVKVARVHRDAFAKAGATLVSSSATLSRLRRKGLTQNSLDGSWGSYTARINRAAFSSDSSIVAVSDLQGHIDSWILEGEEDVTEPEPQISDESDEESDSSSDSDDGPTMVQSKNSTKRRFYGQSWIPNPQSAMLPRLSYPALVLSFRPNSTAEPKRSNGVNGVNGVNGHDTGNGMVDADSAATDDRLFVVTGAHELLEFHVLAGGYTDWSRRNVPSALPEQFKLLRDRAVGCVWDLETDESQRLWLYSAQWLCMFDLAQDLDPGKARTETTDDGKSQAMVLREEDGQDVRSAIARRQRETQLRTTGAGSKIPNHQLGTGVRARKIRKLDSNGNTEIIPLPDDLYPTKQERPDVDEEGDDEDPLSAPEDEADDDATALTSNVVSTKGKAASNRRFYCTTRYRPILSIVPLSRELDSDLEGETDRTNELEVALIERPFWDLQLPPRFLGAHEHDT